VYIVCRAFYGAIRSLSIELFFLLIIIACGHAGFTRRHSGPTSSLFLSRTCAHSCAITQRGVRELRERKCITRCDALSFPQNSSLSSRYYYILRHYAARWTGRPVTFTFVGFLLFSVMPRDCVAEIESAAPLWTRRLASPRLASPRLAARNDTPKAISSADESSRNDDLRFRDGNRNARGGSRRPATTRAV